jgi:hypothetical protein
MSVVVKKIHELKDDEVRGISNRFGGASREKVEVYNT